MHQSNWIGLFKQDILFEIEVHLMKIECKIGLSERKWSDRYSDRYRWFVIKGIGKSLCWCCCWWGLQFQHRKTTRQIFTEGLAWLLIHFKVSIKSCRSDYIHQRQEIGNRQAQKTQQWTCIEWTRKKAMIMMNDFFFASMS